jgi:uncharacterized RDD family membrane protein YckC
MTSEIRVPIGLTTEGLLGRRYLARLIDSIAFVVLLGVLGILWGVVVTGRNPSLVRNLVLPIMLFFGWIAYGTLLESSKVQATIGKRLMGLRVYNAQGGRLALMHAAGRNLVKDGPFLLLGLVPGTQLLMLVWLALHLVVMHRSPVYQAIHDRAAHSWVAAPEQTTQLRIA